MQRLVAHLLEELGALERDPGLVGDAGECLDEPRITRTVSVGIEPAGDEQPDDAVARDDG